MHPTGFLVLANARLSDLMLDANEFRYANSLTASDLAATRDRVARARETAEYWIRRLRGISASRA